MKKYLTLTILLTYIIGNAQCQTPSNLTLSIPYATAAQLSWTENGTATSWEVSVVPDFYIGSNIPTNGIIAVGNSYLFTDLPPAYGCYAFFVRSICSATDVSPWVAVGTLGCDANVYNYLATLSNDNFTINNDNNVKIFPNPSSNILFIENIQKQIQKIEFFDLQGRLIITINENKDKYQIDISNLITTTYLIRLSTEKGIETVRFVKK
ncbi:T9SS type A sorting domain-containing protein [Flavobacterium sp.]|uniref:T9SS type A sorting domain-containing protein n=1 Tax=Flavobacterium sp. TaxID=239 RepID=UPI003750B8F4